MNNIKQEAKTLIDQGYKIIPLIENEKGNRDTEILIREYSLDDFDRLEKQHNKPHTNLGINLATSFGGLVDIDADTDEAIKLLPRFFCQKATKIGRRNQNVLETTHILTLNENYNVNDEMFKDINGKKMIEFRTNGNLVIPPSVTPNKKTNVMMPRVWIDNVIPFKGTNIVENYKWCNFATFIYPFLKVPKKGESVLALDGCLKRYTGLTDGERLEFLSICYRTKFPNDWGSKDFNEKKFLRLIKCTNDESKKTGGYKMLAKKFDIDPLETKRAISFVGNIPDENQDKKSKKTLVSFYENAYDMNTILNTEFAPVQYAVDPIIPEGLGLCAGRPKAMKSWTMLYLAYCVQNGLDFMEKPVNQGDVLYLALEDNKRRMKDRVVKLGLDKSLQHPTIVDEAPYLNYGLEESIEEWTKEVLHPRLVIVDTLAKVKQQFDKSNTAYDKDNNLLRDIQKLAMKLSISIVMVSHLGKTQFDYSWDKIQGSTGMQGMTDFMWMLDRGDGDSKSASLHGRGRDIEDFEFALNWNKDTWQYEMDGELWLKQLKENRKEIVDAMFYFAHEKKQLEVKPAEISKYLGATTDKAKANVRKTMERMQKSNDLVNGKSYGTYSILSHLPTEAKKLDNSSTLK
jgi:RecA-family ATPase